MIVALMGGLANQCFQYAFGISVAARKKEDVFFTRNRVDSDIKRSYSLDAFNIQLTFINYETQPFFHDGGSFSPDVYTAPSSTTYVGYWQSEKYFDVPLVRQSMRLRHAPSDESKRVADEIRKGTSAFIHVRRGDYVSEPHTAKFHGNLTMDYYNAAIGRIRQSYPDVRFFVFSDDPEWCKVQFPDFTVVSHNHSGDGRQAGNEHEDLWLMSQCSHAIVANSAFSWWGAWMGDEQTNRIVVAPKRWFQEIEYPDLVPERWERMS